MQQPINFCDIMALGFNIESGHDSVFFDQHGYEYKIFTKMLAPTLMLDWNQETRLCEVLVIRPEDGHIYDRIPVTDTNSLQTLVNSFKKPEADTFCMACTCTKFRETPMINGKHICSICNKPIVQTDR